MRRTLAIAVAAILVFSILSVSANYLYNQQKTPSIQPNFKISISSENSTINQGQSTQVNVNIMQSSGKKLNVTLDATVNSSELELTFSPQTATPNFTSTLTVTAANSTSSNFYQVNVTANNGEINQTATCLVGVLSSKVQVNGRLFSGAGLDSAYEMIFTDVSGGVNNGTYYFARFGDDLNYSVSLENGHLYRVSYGYETYVLQRFFPVLRVVVLENLNVTAPVGVTTLTHNFG